MSRYSLPLWLALLAGCMAHAGGEVRSPPEPAAHSVVVGLCEDFPADSRSAAVVNSDLNSVVQAGCSVLRVGFAWDSIEPSPGQFRWGFWDQLVDQARARGVRIIPYLCYTPRWASSGADKADYWRWPPADPRTFARMAQAAAAHFCGRVQSWELWNEPDNSDYWRGSAAQYAELVRAGSEAVRGADPSCEIVLGGISWNLDFLKSLLRDEHLGPAVDVVNLHAYFETWIPGPIEQVTDEINRAADVIARYGNNQKIWLAETGYSDYRYGSHVSDSYETVYAYEHTPQYQAQALLRVLATAVSTDRVSLAAWYRVNDLPVDQTIIGDVNNRFLGIRKIGSHDKPAALAMRLAVSVLQGNVTCLDPLCRLCRPLRSDSCVHVFRHDDGRLFVVAWLQTDAGGEFANTDRSGSSVDRRVENLTVVIPEKCWVLRSEDALGNLVAMTPVQNAASSTTVPLTLHGDATTVIELFPH